MNLKLELRVVGMKRKASESSSEEVLPNKKLCCSLDLSGTCGRLGEINLQTDSSDCSRERAHSDSVSELEVS